MRKLLTMSLLLTFLLSATAQEKGMNFLHAANWKEVLQQAKKENKYIFVDAFTTWCGPCKYMAANIFPMENVGEFFNSNYINVKVQLDTAKVDNDYIKSWYADAHYIMTHYGVKVFPTYLFLDPNGKLVHRAVGSSDAAQFIEKGKDALDPNKQYYTLKERYDAGERDPEFLYNITNAANNAYDGENGKKLLAAYLATQTDLLTPKNVELLKKNTTSSSDIGFKYMMEQPEKFNTKENPVLAENATRMIIMSEELYKPMFGVRGQAPNWADLQKLLDQKYPARSKEILSYAKVFYYQNLGDWDNFSIAVADFMDNFGNTVPYSQLNSFAWAVFQNCKDAACVEKALNWSRRASDATKDASYLDTYANLLFKNGKQKEAIAVQENAVAIAKKEGDANVADLEETLEKMKRGEKTWQ